MSSNNGPFSAGCTAIDLGQALYMLIPGSRTSGSTSMPTGSTCKTPAYARASLSLLNELYSSKEQAMPLDHKDSLPPKDPRRTDSTVSYNPEAGEFVKFDRRVKALDKTLQAFINAIRPIGSSDDLLSSTSSLRTRLVELHSGFRRNAARLFPELERLDSVKDTPWSGARHLSRQPVNTGFNGTSVTPTVLGNVLDNFAEELIWFLQLLNEFPEFTDDIVNISNLDFYDDLRYWASCLLEYDAGQNSSWIAVTPPQDEQYRPIDRHINRLPNEMGDYLTELNTALVVFVDVGVPAIRIAQDRATTHLQNLSTVATFLSAVTAATLQYSYASKSTSLDLGVNVLWLASLIFSLASAINSQLSYHWHSATYRRPHLYLPMWIHVWMVHTPLLFLITSTFTFSVGLVCFSFTAFNGTFVPKIILACASVAFTALLSVGGWFIGEKYGSSRRKHFQGPSGAVDNPTRTHGSSLSRFRSFVAPKDSLWRSLLWRNNDRLPWSLDYENTAGAGTNDHDHDSLAPFPPLSDHISQRGSAAGDPPDESSHDPPSIRTIRRLPIRPLPRLPIPGQTGDAARPSRSQGSRYWSHNRGISVQSPDGSSFVRMLDLQQDPIATDLLHPQHPIGPRPLNNARYQHSITMDRVRPLPRPLGPPLASIPPPPPKVYRARPLPIPVSRSVEHTPRASVPSSPGMYRARPLPIPVARPTARSPLDYTPSSPGTQSLEVNLEQMSTITPSPLALGFDSVAGSLRLLRRVQTLKLQASSSTLVAPAIAFDPKGRYLSSSDPSNLRSIVIWKLGHSDSEIHRKLLHPLARLGSGGVYAWDELEHVAWSNSGDQLLTQSSAMIAIWDPNSGASMMELNPKQMLPGRFRAHEAITAARWMPNDQAVIFALGAEVHVVTLGGTIEWSHAFQNLSVYDVSINHLENTQMLLVIGRVGSQGSVGLKPSRSRVENRIVVVNVESKVVESLVPNFHTMTSIALAPSGRQVLVGYDEDEVPSELFDLHENDPLIWGTSNVLQLSRKYTFEGGLGQFKGPTTFGQIHMDAVESYDLAFGMTKDRLHIWDHESGKLLHTLPLPSQNRTPSSRLRDTVAWNNAGGTMMMIAMASGDGTIEVWSAPSPHVSSRDSSAFNVSLPHSEDSERTLVA